ncbi:cobalamin biosynthesis protein [Gordoniibacillus kamchatkensis]|uniref:Cobalamin biosynthesis protein CobD n=1 Tax=Gordoniibacillus kamchatkensis TaxID=1590651 RepID=A0ABR5A5D5_9BACL|nr:adenosylcobinamide-phosphate synthase CbiB [Paenibacillus sp. VKM B-2647]KIL36251.1 cobalamin biosynthesis protein [Paenibacillus sp. VKM B-2647]
MLLFGYTLQETMAMSLAAVVIDWLVGDPARLPHPVVGIGRWIVFADRRLRRPGLSPSALKLRGVALLLSTLLLASGAAALAVGVARWLHPYLGYAAGTWLISTTLAVKGLKDAAMKVYKPLSGGNLQDARKYTGYIVGRDTAGLGEEELTRAVVETVAENIVDAFVSPLLFAILGGAPLAMLYRAANTLDSMVGYKNDKYVHFGWASARWDDVMNYVPARLAGALIILAAAIDPRLAGVRAARSIRRFAKLHPSPNSGIPEAAVAGALGIELGGRNVYFGVASERARLGWPLRERRRDDILAAVRILYAVSALAAGGLVIGLWLHA